MSNSDSIVCKSRDYYTARQIETARSFFLNMLSTLEPPTRASEVITLINALGLAICYTYPIDLGNGYYKLGQYAVKDVNSYLASIVSLRHAINHPTDSAKWTLAAQCFVKRAKDDSRFDNVPYNLKQYCLMLERTDVVGFLAYASKLFDSAAAAKAHAIVKMDIKIPRGRKHQFAPDVIEEARLVAPIIYKSLPDLEFCVVMKDTLLDIEAGRKNSLKG